MAVGLGPESRQAFFVHLALRFIGLLVIVMTAIVVPHPGAWPLVGLYSLWSAAVLFRSWRDLKRRDANRPESQR